METVPGNLHSARLGIILFLAAALFLPVFLFIPQPYAASAAGSKPVPVSAQVAPNNFTQLAKDASPAVVNIRTEKTLTGGNRVFEHFFGGPGGRGQEDPFGEFFDRFFNNQPQHEYKQRSLGSGFIIEKEGYIVTNNHVISDADEIQVKLKDGGEYDAEIIGSDASTDIALIRIKSDHELPVLEMGDSSQVDVGQWILAIGNPFGLEHTVTAGIISAKGRVIGAGPYDDFLQTDASINPGNSGGPLIDMNGKVIGISTAIVAGGEGIGFAIPVNLAKNIIEQLKKTGEVTRGWMGVAIQDLTPDLQEYYGVDHGVLVTEVFKGDPADKAGIQPSDIILSVNGEAVNSSRDLSRLVAGLAVGNKAQIKLFRNGKTQTVEVTVAKREEAQATAMGEPSQQPPEKSALGIQVSDITNDIAGQLNLENTSGVVVVGVDDGSKGSQAGVTKGDVIKQINHKPVENVEDYKKIINGIKPGETIQMYIKRAFQGYTVIKMTK